MSTERLDEKSLFLSLEKSPKNTSSSQIHQFETKNSGHDANSTIINSASLNLSEKVQLPSPFLVGFAIPSPSLSTDPPEPYVSVGCLKCGAPDHVATNRNCPRPRKSALVAYAKPSQTPIAKKNTTRSPKKPNADNHHLKEAKVGDDTKFWYYTSDDSDDDGEQGDSSTAKRVRIEKDEKNQVQASNAASNYLLNSPGDESRLPVSPASEPRPPGISVRRNINKGSRKAKKEVAKPSQENDMLTKAATYGFSIGGIEARHPSTPSERHGTQIQVGHRLGAASIYDENGLGSIPSLPWEILSSSPVSPTKGPPPSPTGGVTVIKVSRQRKTAPTSERSPPKQTRKMNRGSHAAPTKTPVSKKSQQNASPIDSIRGAARSSRVSRQPILAQANPITPSRPPVTTQKCPKINVNSTSTQTAEDSYQVGTPVITSFRYNYMGAFNNIQSSGVGYADNRMQGWKDCRSMGTGLE